MARINFTQRQAGSQVATGTELDNALVQYHTATADPTVTDDSAAGFPVTTMWLNTVTNTMFLSVIDTPGAASWQKIGAISGAPGYAYAQNLAGTSIPDATYTQVPFATIVEDVDGVINGATGLATIPANWNGRLVQVTAGFIMGWATGTTKSIDIVYNGTKIASNRESYSASNGVLLTVSAPVIRVATGDTFTVEVYQNSGSAQPLTADARNFLSLLAV